MTEKLLTPEISNVKLREQFVKDLNGTTMEEVIVFSLQTPLLTFLTLFLELCILNRYNINVYKSTPPSIYISIAVFTFEAMSVVLPIVLSLTVLSDFIYLMFLCIIIIVFAIITYSVSSPDDYVLYWKWPQNAISQSVLIGKQPFITYFRSFVFLVTAISILAVDFHVYPRRFAKTETFGVSLMDLGVGLFVIANALVVKTYNTLSQGFLKTFLESTVFFALGVIRYFCIQRLEYQKHETEYGVHWNFFITLALVKLLSYFILKISRGYSFICALVLMLTHQYFLSTSLEAFVLGSTGRDGWLNANREGIISLCGYLSLFFIGVAISNIVNPTNKQLSTSNKARIFVLLILFSVTLFFATYYIDSTFLKVSRRLANLPYILWISAISVSILTVCLVVELLSLWFLPIQPRFKSQLYSMITPAILESINFNGLLFFLISNLLTGIINLYIDVFNLEVKRSLALLLTYIFVNCAVVYKLHLNKYQVKLW